MDSCLANGLVTLGLARLRLVGVEGVETRGWVVEAGGEQRLLPSRREASATSGLVSKLSGSESSSGESVGRGNGRFPDLGSLESELYCVRFL